MRIQFEIREKLPEIVEEILHSDKWLTRVKEKTSGLIRVTIKDPYYDSEAFVEIWEHEIHLTTAWSNYSYRIYRQGNVVWCEYIGAYRGLLEQNLLPTLTPKDNFLDAEVLSSSLIQGEKETLRNYSMEQVKNRQGRPQTKEGDAVAVKDHPKVVSDEFVKIGVPIPPPYPNRG